MDGSNGKMKCNMKFFLCVVGVIGIILANYVSADCEQDLRGLEIECLYYMHKGVPPMQNPNDRCCNLIKVADVPCVCSKLSRHIGEYGN